MAEEQHQANDSDKAKASETSRSSRHGSFKSLEDTAPTSSEKSSSSPHHQTNVFAKDRDQPADVEKLDQIADAADQPEKAPRNPNIVDFDGPDDPALAINWSSSKKWTTVAVLSFLTLVTPLASSMFAPGVPLVMQEFQSTDSVLESLVVSVYVLGYACGPVIISPLSELYGLMPLYNATNVLFLIFTIACGVSSSLNMLIGFRFLQGIAGSGALSLGGATVAWLFEQKSRGRAMAIWSSGALLGPVAGPIGGGFLCQAKGWRWVFWVIAIAAAFVTVFMGAILREHYAPVILEKKVKRLRKETGNNALRSKLDRGLTPGKAFSMAIVRPMKMLLLSPIVLIMSTFMAVVYGYLYLLFTTITVVFELEYGFTQGTVGLAYIGIGVGMFVGLTLFGFLSDRILKAKAGSGEMKPEYRLPLLFPGALAIPIGLFLYGWTAQYRVFWIAPIIGTSFVGLGLIGSFMPIQTYLVDSFPLYAASATAAATIWRSILGALLPLAGLPMYQRLGLGWGNSLLGFIAVAFLPVPLLLSRYGERIRTNPKYQPNL